MEYRNDYQYIGVIELENGDYYDVVKVTTKNGVYLEAGSATNRCFFSCYGVDCSDDLDESLNRLYERILEAQQQEADLDELLRDY